MRVVLRNGDEPGKLTVEFKTCGFEMMSMFVLRAAKYDVILLANFADPDAISIKMPGRCRASDVMKVHRLYIFTCTSFLIIC